MTKIKVNTLFSYGSRDWHHYKGDQLKTNTLTFKRKRKMVIGFFPTGNQNQEQTLHDSTNRRSSKLTNSLWPFSAARVRGFSLKKMGEYYDYSINNGI